MLRRPQAWSPPRPKYPLQQRPRGPASPGKRTTRSQRSRRPSRLSHVYAIQKPLDNEVKPSTTTEGHNRRGGPAQAEVRIGGPAEQAEVRKKPGKCLPASPKVPNAHGSRSSHVHALFASGHEVMPSTTTGGGQKPGQCTPASPRVRESRYPPSTTPTRSSTG